VIGDGENGITEGNVRSYLMECLGPFSSKELDWLSDCLSRGMRDYLEVEDRRKFLRLPLALADPNYVSELRRGAALRALRRLFVLCRVETIIEDCLDDTIAGK
jgi:hypothetical protein